MPLVSLKPRLKPEMNSFLGGQPVVRRMLRHNAIEAWETMQKSGGWKRCQPK